MRLTKTLRRLFVKKCQSLLPCLDERSRFDVSHLKRQLFGRAVALAGCTRNEWNNAQRIEVAATRSHAQIQIVRV
jgi:RNase P subunit RPR2